MPTQPQRELIYQKMVYAPSQEQWAIHNNPARIRLVAGGERAGKSKSSAMEYIGRFWETPLLWLVAADYERTRAEFSYICEAFDTLGIDYIATKQVDPGEINAVGGFRVVTKSAKDPRKLAMEAPDGIIVCEASQVDYETFLRLRGRIAEKRGWLLLSGTFESSLGWYPELYNRGQTPATKDGLKSFSLPTWSNLAIYPGGRQDPEILALERESSFEWFQERYGGVPCPPRGLVFHEFRNEIHTGAGGHFEFDPTFPVYLWVDPGYAHYYAVEVAQKRGDQVIIIDEIYVKGLTTSEVVSIVDQKPWRAQVVGGAIDIAATQHQAMPAPAEIWAKEGRIPLKSQKLKIQDGIERFKASLKVNPITNVPQILIHSKCQGLISELGGCPNPDDGQTRVYKWKEDRDGNILGDVPLDRNNDACKAVCYGLVDLLGHSGRRGNVLFRLF